MYVWIPSRNEVIEVPRSTRVRGADPFPALTQGLRDSGTPYEVFIGEAETRAYLLGTGVDPEQVDMRTL